MLTKVISVKTVVIILIAVLLIPRAGHTTSRVPFVLPPKSELNKLKRAIVYTVKGNIHIELFPEEAPWHVANLKYLADKGFYKNNKFHLHYDNYIIQGGDPRGDGMGGPGYSLPAEYTQRLHDTGTVGMARIPDSVNPERRSNGSQFHILLRPAPRMNGNYTIIGRVIHGMDIARSIRKEDRILDLVVYVRP